MDADRRIRDRARESLPCPSSTSKAAALNYRGLTPAQIDSLRVDVDPGDTSRDAVTEFREAGVKDGETVIAYALLPPCHNPGNAAVTNSDRGARTLRAASTLEST